MPKSTPKSLSSDLTETLVLAIVFRGLTETLVFAKVFSALTKLRFDFISSIFAFYKWILGEDVRVVRTIL